MMGAAFFSLATSRSTTSRIVSQTVRKGMFDTRVKPWVTFGSSWLSSLSFVSEHCHAFSISMCLTQASISTQRDPVSRAISYAEALEDPYS